LEPLSDLVRGDEEKKRVKSEKRGEDPLFTCGGQKGRTGWGKGGGEAAGGSFTKLYLERTEVKTGRSGIRGYEVG